MRAVRIFLLDLNFVFSELATHDTFVEAVKVAHKVLCRNIRSLQTGYAIYRLTAPTHMIVLLRFDLTMHQF